MSLTPSTKASSDLGHRVHQHLVSLGIETPMSGKDTTNSLMKHSIREATLSMMTSLGLDMTDDSLSDTPNRIAKMWVDELYWGLNYDNFPKATVVQNKMLVDEMVLERNVKVHSTCEHHLLPIIGVAHVAYIAKDKVLGLSKINRIVEFFSRRPQIQERLASQICETLKLLLGTDNVAVIIEAEHMCVKTRGVEDACSDTITSKMSGTFRTVPTARAELLAFVGMKGR